MADFYSFLELEPADTLQKRQRAAARLQADNGSTWGRATIVNEEYPNPPYPHGFYLEGWIERPEQTPDFDFPLTAQQEGGQP